MIGKAMVDAPGDLHSILVPVIERAKISLTYKTAIFIVQSWQRNVLLTGVLEVAIGRRSAVQCDSGRTTRTEK